MNPKPMEPTTITCMLFTPANRPDRYEKGVATGADGVVVDLEDSIPLAEKDSARATVVDYFKEKGRIPADRPFVSAIRLNNIHTLAGLKDLSALVDSGIRPDVLLLPKVESPVEVQILESHLMGRQAEIRFMALIETALGLQNADAIARCSERLNALVFGGADLAADLGADPGWEPMLFARARLVQAAAMAGIVALDVPYLNLQDMSGLRPECIRVKALGFVGKFSIHPKHVPVVMEAFRPDPASVSHAHRIVEAYEAVQGNACEVDGKMVDLPVYRSARRTLALAGK
jgi:citrate lyase beta subunit